jgi:hypothetical protein
VEETDSMPPKKILSMVDHPNNLPVINPNPNIDAASTTAVMEAAPPTLVSFLKLNSSPRLNSKNITPISAHIVMLFSSVTVGRNLKYGPTNNPAKM